MSYSLYPTPNPLTHSCYFCAADQSSLEEVFGLFPDLREQMLENNRSESRKIEFQRLGTPRAIRALLAFCV